MIKTVEMETSGAAGDEGGSEWRGGCGGRGGGREIFAVLGQLCILTAVVINESTGAKMTHSTPMSSSWFGNCTVIMKDKTTGGNWMKGT